MFKRIRLAVWTAICALSLVAVGVIEPASAAGPGFAIPDQVDASEAALLPYKALGTYTSNPEETEVAFLERMRPILRAFSDKTAEEACAEIAVSTDGKTWGIVLGSSESHLGCAIYPDKVAAGMAASGVTIHSHGGPRVFYMNHADRIMAHMTSGDGLIPVHGQVLDHFSPTDYAGGPGYLATPTGLLYQDGKPGSERAVK